MAGLHIYTRSSTLQRLEASKNLRERKKTTEMQKQTAETLLYKNHSTLYDFYMAYLGLSCFCSIEMEDLLMNSKQSAMASE